MKLFGDTSVLLRLIYVISICSDFLMSTEDGLNTANILTHCQIKNMFPKRVKVSLSCLSLDFQPQNVKKIHRHARTSKVSRGRPQAGLNPEETLYRPTLDYCHYQCWTAINDLGICYSNVITFFSKDTFKVHDYFMFQKAVLAFIALS